MELQRPRFTSVLPQCDLGIVVEALSKPSYEPLREASFKHLALKTVFHLAMASAGRLCELHALVFDPQYIYSSNLKELCLPYISPQSSCEKIRGQTKSMIRGISQRFGAPNCPVRALKYHHRYMSEYPELRKGRRCLFIPSNDNNAGNGASISRWICTTIVDSHASIQSSKNIPGKVKAHKVHAVATSLKLFNKVNLQAVMKAGRWSSGGPFTPSLQDLCSQADSMEDRTSRSRRRDRGNFLLGELNYVYFVSLGSYIPLSLVLLFKKRGVSWRTHRDFR